MLSLCQVVGLLKLSQVCTLLKRILYFITTAILKAIKILSKGEKQSRKSEKERKEKRKKGDSRERHPSNRNTSWVGLEPTVPSHLADESHSHYPKTPPDRP